MNKITKRSEDYSQWYLDVIAAADLAENSSVRGCMVIKPNGYALWENIQKILDAKFKATGVKNAYFPLFIPKSFLEKEAEHVEGFAKECAVVTHHRLAVNNKGGLEPASPLENPLVIRPTSETIIYDAYSKWVKSYRDLPILINQWCNIVRWEMRTRLFLRTTEFLWQEGHTVHSSRKEAEERTEQMINIYKSFMEEYLAIPIISGRKTEAEQFPGADYTTCTEAMMQDGKALQAGTSHMLGQNFAKAFKIKFLNKKEEEEYAYQTSWGLSTRLIGALIMVHSDDKGLVLPPKIAPLQLVIVPIWKNDTEKKTVLIKANSIAEELREKNISVEVDERDERPGGKFFNWEKQGVPIRLEIGPKDIANRSVVLARRDNGEKITVKNEKLITEVEKTLTEIQKNLFDKALDFQQKNTHNIDSWDDFRTSLKKKPGFILAHWCGDPKCEEVIQKETKATIRCIPFEQKKENGKCVFCGKRSVNRVVFAKAY